VVGDLKATAMVYLYKPMTLIVQVCPDVAVQILAKPLIKLLHVLLTGEVRPHVLFLCLCERSEMYLARQSRAMFLPCIHRDDFNLAIGGSTFVGERRLRLCAPSRAFSGGNARAV
jgi:hypothetical protein